MPGDPCHPLLCGCAVHGPWQNCTASPAYRSISVLRSSASLSCLADTFSSARRGNLGPMQPLVCSRPFASGVQGRASPQNVCGGVALSPPQHRQQQQRPAQQALAPSYSASSSIRGCCCNSFAGAALPVSPLVERQIRSGDATACAHLLSKVRPAFRVSQADAAD